jgi:hypothetical protein
MSDSVTVIGFESSDLDASLLVHHPVLYRTPEARTSHPQGDLDAMPNVRLIIFNDPSAAT